VAQNRQALEELKLEVNGNKCSALSHLVDVFLQHYTAAEQSSINLPMPKSMGISSTSNSSEIVKSSSRQRTRSSTTEMLDTISKKLLEGGTASGSHDEVELSGLEWLEEDVILGEDVMTNDNGISQSSRGQCYSSSDRESEEAMEDALVISREELNTGLLMLRLICTHTLLIIFHITSYCTSQLSV